MAALQTNEIYARAVALSKDVDDNFLELAKTLRQLQERDADMFHKVLTKARIGSRKAYYLINISKWFDGLPVSKARLRKIGWTKLQVIGPHVTAQYLDELLELAESKSTAALKTHVKGDDPRSNSHCVLMYFSPEQYTVFEGALVKAGAQKNGRGMVDKETALIKLLAKADG